MEPKEWKARYALLIFDCIIGFGTYFNIDLPSALQDQLQGEYVQNCNISHLNRTKCCSDCLGLSSEQYNLLYAVFLWLNAALAMPMGFLIDRMGNRVAALLSTLMSALGSTIFALCILPGIKHTHAMFPMLVLGRAFLGAGAVSVRIVQDRLIAHWFPDRLELVFGLIVCVLRLGNVCNFLLSSNIAEWLGIEMAAWTGAVLCGVCFLSAIVLVFLDFTGSKIVDVYIRHESSTSSKLVDVREFPVAYWVVVMMIFSFYAAYIPLVANGGKYIQEKYGFSETDASYINGISYDVAVFACPLVGVLLNHCCSRYVAATFGVFLLIPTLILLITTSVSPIIIALFIGIVYSFVAVSIWPSIAKNVPLKNVGTANGIALTSDGMIGGFSSILVGHLLQESKSIDKSGNLDRWHNYFLFLMACSTMCFCCGVVLNMVDQNVFKACHGKRNKGKERYNIQETENLINGDISYGTVDNSDK